MRGRRHWPSTMTLNHCRLEALVCDLYVRLLQVRGIGVGPFLSTISFGHVIFQSFWSSQCHFGRSTISGPHATMRPWTFDHCRVIFPRMRQCGLGGSTISFLPTQQKRTLRRQRHVRLCTLTLTSDDFTSDHVLWSHRTRVPDQGWRTIEASFREGTGARLPTVRSPDGPPTRRLEGSDNEQNVAL